MTNFSRSLAVAAALLFASSAPLASGQSQSINGTIRGQVTDKSGAPVPNASLTIRNADTGYTRQLTSDSEGRYIAPNLPIGTYSIEATAASFAPLKQNGIHIGAGTDSTIDEALKTGSVATEVTVTSEAPMIEAARSDLGRTITSTEMQNLPLTSRNPYNFILFQPGVSGHPNPENGIPRTVNTNGLVDRINYQLDGMVDTETDRYGLRLFAISDSYAESVNTISNAFNAEFGNTAGVIYNVITPAGTNQLHGAAQYIWRPKAASSCPILQNCALANTPKPNLHVDDVVGRLGGPIIRDKFFLFGAYEHLRRGNPQAVTVTAPNQAQLIALGVPVSDFNTAPQVQHAQWVDVRGDWNINTKNTAFIRYNYFRNYYPFNTNAGGLYLQSAEADFQDRAHIIGAQLITTFKPTLLNEFRGSWPYRNEQHFAGATTGTGPEITISGVVNGFGGSTGVGDKFQEKIPSFSDNVTLIRGAHQFKFGAGFQKNNDTQLQDVYTQFTFPSIAAYTAALQAQQSGAPSTDPRLHGYSTINASLGRPGAGYQTVFFDFFAQDAWQFSPKLVANYGVRYDQYRAPTPIANAYLTQTQNFRTPMANFAPRIGFAYTPHDGTVMRLFGGLFYEATPTNTYFNPLYSNGNPTSGNLIASLSGSSGPAFPNTFSLTTAIPTTVLTPYALTPDFKNEYAWDANAQVEQALGKSDALTIGYTMTNGRNLQFLRNSNLINPISYLADGRPVFNSSLVTTPVPSRADTRYNNISYIDIGANSAYNALVTNYTHRVTGGLTVSASYTWSHAIADDPEANSYENSNFIEDPTNRKRDRGNSYINRPNAFTFSGVYQPNTHYNNKFLNGLATGNNLAVLVNASSGDQQNEISNLNLDGDARSSGQQRPLFVGRNTLRAPKIIQADARFTRTFGTYFERIQPQIIVEANNFLNRSNFTSINTTATTNTAGVITSNPTLVPTSSVLEARILQFGARINF